ncbi:arabinose efflux permease family protein [Desulfosporosinus orientis DSM 765]|uniref:Arabinose efflux permease family protein n=1 Tax=Desulfosporosinus orientis (strain ATCC 19365 / DSM 765 / NCIMB 8382 / VKM B-1628 / Singapore I) TaxID=768706 RepID=G7W9B5_DESOD|nr:MFS transporter [Desulfosporosinus orientis]AET69252.1 arabinose efflux permease family protein [Desulfosporosinus orientis DSM 765]
MINKEFTLLWLGKIISQLGDKFYAIALAWWILQRTNSPAVMGFFLLASALPGILLGIFAGVMTDRWKRKTILVVTDMIRGCLVLVIASLAMVNVLEVWHVFLIGVCLSFATAFFEPAMLAIIPEIVEKEKLTKANGLSQMVSGACSVAGPLFGAIAVSVFGLARVFLANSISYFFASLLAGFITVNKDYRVIKTTNIWEEISEGVSFIKRQKPILFVLKVIALAHLFMGSLTVTLPFLARGLQGNGVNNLGYLEMMLGVGLFAGSLIISIKKKASVNERTLITFIIAAGFSFMVIAVSQYFYVQAVYIYMLIMTAIGACIAGAFVFWQSLLHSYTPGNMTGRVFSIATLISNISLPVSYCLFGLLLNISSILFLMAASGVCLIVLCIYFYFQREHGMQY